MTGNNSLDLIPVRMLTQFAYCNRLSYMEWVQGEFAENLEVAEGTYSHRNVDTPQGRTKDDDDGKETIHTKSVFLSDVSLGLTARLDILEVTGTCAIPVEYKRGKVPETPRKAHEDHMTQICAQGLLLRANGYTCDKGVIYYVASKQKITIDFDEELIADTKQKIADMRAMAEAGKIPPPLVDSPKCPKCSLVGICLPDETHSLSGNEVQVINKDQIRRMYPTRDDAMPLYVQAQGARISKSSDCLHVKSGEETQKIRLIDVSQVTILGNIQITTQAIRALCEAGIPICYLTYGGWFVGMTHGLSHKNVEIRMLQHKRSSELQFSIAIARSIVFGKIKNCITMLKRNNPDISSASLSEIEQYATRAQTAKTYETLLGLEGMAARIYFSHFNGMLKSELPEFQFNGRNRRPPKDPVNAILSFLYAMLTRQATVTVNAMGLDPYLGFFHKPKYGKPALALDMIEEFRPLVADSVCITLINNKEITKSDMVITKFGVNLTSQGRRTVITAYERRMDSTVTHPLLGYAASYRRIIETQARLLSRHLLGEIPAYPSFRTR